MVVQYNFNDEVIEKYLERGKKLAFLVGHKDDRVDVITASHLIIPTQHDFQIESNTENGNYFIF